MRVCVLCVLTQPEIIRLRVFVTWLDASAILKLIKTHSVNEATTRPRTQQCDSKTKKKEPTKHSVHISIYILFYFLHKRIVQSFSHTHHKKQPASSNGNSLYTRQLVCVIFVVFT